MILTLKSRSFKGTFGIFDFLWISSVFSDNFRHFRTFVYRVRLFVRIPAYVIGLLIMTLGVAISVKSNLGVSPVSSIPYTITCVVGLEMGKATILFHAVLVLLQILLLRRAFQAKNLLQIFAGILFGYFTTFCNSLMVFFPDPTNLIVRLAMMLFSTGLIAFGLFWYVPADIIPLAGEGAMLAISKTIKKPFPTVKIAFDVTMVVISLVTCLICLHSLGSVGIGTIAAAILVGMELRWITKKCGAQRDAILGVTKKETAQSPLLAIMKQEVYTVSEETSIRDALHLITEKKISGVPVTDGSQNLIGFLSDGDILRFLADVEPLFINASALQELPNFEERTKELMAMQVRDIAKKQVISVGAEMELGEVCQILTENHIKKAPVLENGKMIGIINMSNITKYVLRKMM